MEIMKDELKKISGLFSLKSKSLKIDKLFSDGIIYIDGMLSIVDLELLSIICEKMNVKEIVIRGESLNQLGVILELTKSEKYIIDDEILYQYLRIDNYIEYGDENNLTDKSDIEVYQVLYNFREIIDNYKIKYKDIIDKYDNIEFIYVDNMSKKSLDNPSNRSISSKNLKDKDKIMDMIIIEVKSLKLSPLENYIYLYNIVKMFKMYNVEDDKSSAFVSRKNEFTLFNNYMVCLGYADLLVELIDKLNDPNLKAVEYMCLMDEKETDAHVRCMININDSKYGIKGVYMCDPTADRITEHNVGNYYYHLLLTKKEIDKVDLYFNDKVLPDCTDVLFYSDSRFSGLSIPNISWSVAHFVNWKLNCSNKPIVDCKLNERINLEQKPVSREVIEQAVREVYNKIYLPNNNVNLFSRYRETKNKNNYEEFIEEIILDNRNRNKDIDNLIKK